MSRTRSGSAITTPRRRRVTPRPYRAAFAARVRQARTAARYPINEMALLLGVRHCGPPGIRRLGDSAKVLNPPEDAHPKNPCAPAKARFAEGVALAIKAFKRLP
jgi:hypothetical protein